MTGFLLYQSPTEVLSPDDKQTDSQTADSEHFNSFQFWREPLPSLDDDLLALLVRSSLDPGLLLMDRVLVRLKDIVCLEELGPELVVCCSDLLVKQRIRTYRP